MVTACVRSRPEDGLIDSIKAAENLLVQIDELIESDILIEVDPVSVEWVEILVNANRLEAEINSS